MRIDFNIFFTVVIAMAMVEVLKAGFIQYLMDRRHKQMQEALNSGDIKELISHSMFGNRGVEDKIRKARNEN